MREDAERVDGLAETGGSEDARSEFLARVAHDLRSPLGVVQQTLAQFRSEFGPDMSSTFSTLWGLADRSLRRLARIADRLTLLSALERGAPMLVRRPTHLGTVAQTTIDLVTSIDSKRGVTVSLDAPGAPLHVEIDDDRLVAALAEIVTNAIKHASTQVRVALAQSSAATSIVVEDDGDGIAPGRADRIFDRYGAERNRAGLGIGLSIARTLVEAHGGRIEVGPSTLPAARGDKRGARFEIVLPR